MSGDLACGMDLECPVCTKVYVQPRILPCRHTICEACLDKLVVGSSVTCPVDKSIHGVPEEGISRFTLNYYLISLVDSMCGLCRRRHPEEKCPHCANQLCKDCIKGHVLQHEATKSLEKLHNTIIDTERRVKTSKPHPRQANMLMEIDSVTNDLCQMMRDRSYELKVCRIFI